MSHVPHELSEEFPDRQEAIASLRASDAHFARLTDRYHVVNRAIHRAETNVEPHSDSFDTALRRERMQLKDQIAASLSQAPTS